MITIKDIDKAWDNYRAFKDTAEQHDFPKILMLDLKLIPFYEDLHKNWDERHAAIFMEALGKVGQHFGFSLC